MMRERVVALVTVVAIANACAAFADYPEKPITLLTGYGAGSAGDQIARGLAEAAKKHLRQPIVVVNRPGASGTLAIAETLRAAADGHTLGLGTVGNLTVQPNRTDLPYAGPETYAPVAKLVTYPNVLMVRAGAPWTTMQGFLNHAREHPGEVSVGVPGLATVAHLNLAELQVLAKLQFKVISFEGPQQLSAAVLGQVDAAIAGPGPILALVNEGKAVALGVFDERRLPLARDIPTFKELGFAVTLGSLQGIVAPRGTPGPVIKALAEAIRKAVTEPSFVSVAEKTQNTIDYKGPAAFAAELGQSFERSRELIRRLGLGRK